MYKRIKDIIEHLNQLKSTLKDYTGVLIDLRHANIHNFLEDIDKDTRESVQSIYKLYKNTKEEIEKIEDVPVNLELY